MQVLSIITINLNNRTGLAGTLASVFAQRFSGFEYIVIDGGSTDGSRELVEQHADRIHYWVSEKDRGIYDAMNKGIAAAHGEYLIFLNSGDSFTDATTLERCMQHIAHDPAADILYADYYEVGHPDREPARYRYPVNFTLRELKKHIPCQQASLVKSAVFKDIGPFPLRYRIASDYWMFLKSFLAGKKFVYMDFVMARYHVHGLSVIHAQVCYDEMHEIWQQLVPEAMRQKIDRRDALQKSRWGILYQRVLSKFGIKPG